MALNPQYVTSVDLENYFVDKSTGQPLAGGIVSFWEDTARTVPKLVYELTGAPPNYTYTALPNPIILSNTGTFQDSSGNNIAVYYFPYDANDNIQLYYITVTDSMGVEQFTREAWPNIEQSADATQANISNQLTNPQFAQVLFIPTTPLVITTAGAGTLSVTIAPDWVLNITTSGVGTVTVTRNSITGSTAYPFNPPYTLTIAPGVNVTGLTLVQKLPNNPGIWSPQTGATDGWVAASILLAPLSSLTMSYVPSTGTSTVLLTANNLSGIYAESTATVQLPPSNNTESSDTGYVSIVLTLPAASTVTLSNVQVVTLESNVPDVAYEQTTVNRQFDQMFNYYNQLLQYKPIPSYLIGWDFPLNPAQFLSKNIAAQATGANTSYYAWDQTILFQSANSGITVSPYLDMSLTLTANNTTQLAIIQYLEAPMVNEMLLNDMAVNLRAYVHQTAGIPVTISLYYTTGTLPNLGANASIVATLNADGSVATFHNGSQAWVPIARSNLGKATVTIPNVITHFADYPFSGWRDTTGGFNGATYFAIVVGTGSITAANSITIQSISCVPGQIATIPAPKSISQTLLDCQRYYFKTFAGATIPATGVANDYLQWVSSVAAANLSNSPSFSLPVEMRAGPTFTGYNPVNNNAQAYDFGTATDCNTTNVAGFSKEIIMFTTTPGGSAAGHALGINVTADARLGLV